MKGFTSANYRPYTTIMDLKDRDLPVICRLAPGSQTVELEWFDNGYDGAHEVIYRKCDTNDDWIALAVDGAVITINGFEDYVDYEMKIRRVGCEGESNIRYVRTGDVPDTVITYFHPKDREINPIGYCPSSPCLCRLPSGVLLAMYDVWAPLQPSHVSQIMRSVDNGKTWRYLTEISPSIWGKMFYHRDKLYILSCMVEYGSLQIMCSEDEGATWCYPRILIPGFGVYAKTAPHKAPVTVVEHNGRLYSGVEYGHWGIGDHQSMVASIGVDEDLMEPSNWKFSPLVKLDRDWPGLPDGIMGGYIEGNVVLGPDGILRNMLRLDYPGTGKAVLLKIDLDDPEGPQQFDAVIDCPVAANSKFETKRDDVTGKYICIGTEQVETIRNPDGTFNDRQRLILSMAVSPDLYNWKVVYRIFDYRELDATKVGFQYPSWEISGDDILVQSRTAFNGADTFHNVNYQLLSVIKDFRQYL